MQNPCTIMLKKCSVKDVKSAINNIKLFINNVTSSGNLLSKKNITAIVYFLTKTRDNFLLRVDDNNIKNVFNLLCNIFEHHPFSPKDVDMIARCHKNNAIKIRNRADENKCYLECCEKLFNLLIHVGHKFSLKQSKCITYFIFLKNPYDHIYYFANVFNSFVNNMKGTYEDSAYIYNHYYRYARHAPSTAYKRSSEIANSCYKTFNDFFINNYQTSVITEDIMIMALHSNLLLTMHNTNKNKSYMLGTHYDNYIIVSTDLFEKFKKDYHSYANKTYEMTHEMFLLLMLNVNIELLHDDILKYLSSENSIDFILSTFYNYGTSLHNLDGAYGWDVKYYCLCIDVKNNTHTTCNIGQVYIVKNVLYVAHIGILHRVKNYKKLFGIFFNQNNETMCYSDDINYHINNVDNVNNTISKNFNNIDVTINNVYTHTNVVLKIYPEIDVDDLLFFINKCFIKIMLNMKNEIMKNEITFDKEDIEIACIKCDAHAISIIMRQVPITDYAIKCMCKLSDKKKCINLLKQFFDNKIVPKFEHIYFHDEMIIYPDFTSLFVFYIKNYPDILNDIINDVTKYLCFYFYSEYHSKTDRYKKLYMSDEDNLYIVNFVEKNIRNLDEDSSAEIYDMMHNHLCDYNFNRAHEFKTTRAIKRMKVDNFNKIKNDRLLLNVDHVLSKHDVINYCLYNNVSINKHVYDYLVEFDVFDAVKYCEDKFGFKPNKETLLTIKDPYIKKRYLERYLESIKNNNTH